MQKIIFINGLSPGDLCLLAYALKSLHECYPGRFETDVRSPCPEIFEGSPYLTPLSDDDTTVLKIKVDYTTVHQSNEQPIRYICGMLANICTQMKLPIKPAPFQGFLHVRDEEKNWFSAPREILGEDVPYWVMDAGWKDDYELKRWPTIYHQQVVNKLKTVQFVQVGAMSKGHTHPILEGKNVINLVGKTNLRELIRLVWNAYGVLTPVSFPMMLAYGLPAHPRFNRASRACVVFAGGREPNHWQEPPNAQFLHTCGMLPCCQAGGCWKSRAEKKGDGSPHDNAVCLFPVKVGGLLVGRCMEMIKPEQVIRAITCYMKGLEL